MHVYEVHTHEMHACKVHAHEVHACEMHVYKVYPLHGRHLVQPWQNVPSRATTPKV
jgi:hypothetical protein